MTRAEERSAVLVIRAWREAGTERADVRARLTRTLDADGPGWEERVAAGEEAIVAAVDEWLRDFRRSVTRR
jgi:hypothetical protein